MCVCQGGKVTVLEKQSCFIRSVSLKVDCVALKDNLAYFTLAKKTKQSAAGDRAEFAIFCVH